MSSRTNERCSMGIRVSLYSLESYDRDKDNSSKIYVHILDMTR